MDANKPEQLRVLVQRWYKGHRLHCIVALTVTVYTVAHYVHVEFLGHGCELLIEPTIELILANMVGAGGE